MKQNKIRVAGLAVALLVTWLPGVAFAKAPTYGRTDKDAVAARVASKPQATLVPPAKKPNFTVKQVWVGGPPWLGGYAKTVIEKAPVMKPVIEQQKPVQKAPEAKQTPSTLQRVWVGGPPWLGGYEVLR